LKFNTNFLIGTALVIVLSSCVPQVETVELYDLKGLMDSQKTILRSADLSITRYSQLNNIKDTTNPDSLDWEDELSRIGSMDLNNSKFRNDYKINEGTESGLKFIKYSLEIPLKKFSGIYYFSIYYQEDPMKPSRIEIRQKASNLVYNSFNNYFLDFKQFDGVNRVYSIYVKGEQDLMLKNPISYEINTKLNPN